MAHTITAYSKVQKVKEEPKFEEADNSGKWSNYVFQAKFEKSTVTCSKHTLPTGDMPVPEKNEEHKVNGWFFH